MSTTGAQDLFQVGDKVKWNEAELAAHAGSSDLPRQHGDGPFVIEEVSEHSGHRCPECSSSNLEVGHDDLIDDGLCLWDGTGDTYYHYVVVRIGPDPQKHWLGADWFLPA